MPTATADASIPDLLGELLLSAECKRRAAHAAPFQSLEDITLAFSDEDWAAQFPGIPLHVLKAPLVVSWGENKRCTDMGRAEFCVGALGMLCGIPSLSMSKDDTCIVLTDFATNEVTGKRPRQIQYATAMYGLQIDDDGVMGAGNCIKGVEASGNFVCMYSTGSNGKAEDIIHAGGYDVWAIKNSQPRTPTDASAAAYLNDGYTHGHAYRDVKLAPYATRHVTGGGGGYRVSFAPQERTRMLVPFREPIGKDLIERLSQHRNAFERLGERIERAILGRNGADASGFRLVQPAYLPQTIIGNEPPPGYGFWSSVRGQKLFDAVSEAEALLAELDAEAAARPKRQGTTTAHACKGEVPEYLRSNLLGVHVAAHIAQEHPELLANHRDANYDGTWTADKPLYLSHCPNYESHKTDPGVMRGTDFCLRDPDGSEFESPTGKCWHTNCNLSTADYVRLLIDNGDLTEAEVYNNPSIRQVYEYRYDGPSIHSERVDGETITVNVKQFLKQFGKTFRMKSWLADKDLIATENDDGSAITHQGLFVRDPDTENDKGFAFGRDRLESLMHLLTSGVMTIADLTDQAWGGGALSQRAAREAGRKRAAKTKACDTTKQGIDCAVFLKNNELHFAAINTKCGTEMGHGLGPKIWPLT